MDRWETVRACNPRRSWPRHRPSCPQRISRNPPVESCQSQWNSIPRDSRCSSPHRADPAGSSTSQHRSRRTRKAPARTQKCRPGTPNSPSLPKNPHMIPSRTARKSCHPGPSGNNRLRTPGTSTVRSRSRNCQPNTGGTGSPPGSPCTTPRGTPGTRSPQPPPKIIRARTECTSSPAQPR